jgi:RNA recognition motif-containing protein
MAVKLFIGNLSFKASEVDLEQLFSGAGEVVSAKVITDRETGRPRGFGFVEMANREDADKAISMFNGHPLVGRPIAVNEAKPREDQPQRGGGDRRGGGRDRY